MHFAARQWQLGESDPFCAVLAANALTSRVNPEDDHVWELWLGRGDHAALALVTSFSRRVDFASIAPLWSVNNVIISQANGYSRSPVITRFMPGYLRAETRVTAGLAVAAEYIAFESHAAGGTYHLANMGSSPLKIRLELVGLAVAGDSDVQMQVIPTDDGQALLAFRVRRDFNPVLILDGAKSDGMSPRKVGVTVKLDPGEKRTLRWACGMRESYAESAALARHWLTIDLPGEIRRLAEASAALPLFETGDAQLDALLALGAAQTAGALAGEPDQGLFLSPRAHKPPAGQSAGLTTPIETYLLAQSAASIAPDRASAMLMRFLSTQREDGFVDWRAGHADFRGALLCLPLLARLAWGIFQYTEDEAFLRRAFPKLAAFFRHWLAQDTDSDGFPEWATAAQTGYPLSLMHGTRYPLADARDISTTESPDLLAFLLSEALSLREMAYYLRDADAEAEFDRHIGALSALLESCWDPDNRAYGARDRDTHARHESVLLVSDAPGGDTMTIGERLAAPARIMVTVVGGQTMQPNFELVVTGVDGSGASILEHVSADAFTWAGGRGRYTTEAVFAAVDTLGTIGLTHVYKISAATPDYQRSDLSAFLPLWAVAIPDEHRDALFDRLWNDYLTPNGISMASPRDPAYAPDDPHGAGGISLFWNTLFGEALIESGRTDKSLNLLMRVLNTQTQVASAVHNTMLHYHPERAAGSGTPGAVAGFVPLHWFLRVLGVRVVGPRKVWAGGAFPFEKPVTLHQHGVTVTRSAKGTDITFPSGAKRFVPPGDALVEVRDEPEAAS
jgi:hypothetical protein